MTIPEARETLLAAAKEACVKYAARLTAAGVPDAEVMLKVATYMRDQLGPWYQDAIGRIGRLVDEPKAPTHRLQ